MTKKLLNCTTSDIKKMTTLDLKDAVNASNGRIICTEHIALSQSIAGDITNAEIAAGYGSDLLLLNGFDVFNPVIVGLPGTSNLEDLLDNLNDPLLFKKNPIKELNYLTGKAVGIHLNIVSGYSPSLDSSQGQICSKETLIEAQNFICLTLSNHSNNDILAINQAISLANKYFYGLIMAGIPYHRDGANPELVRSFINNGTDIVLLPSIGTSTNTHENDLKLAADICNQLDVLSMVCFNKCQTIQDIKELSLKNKQCGIDIHHVSDEFYNGLPSVDTIYQLSLTIRGLRHTMNRIGQSINR
ncbi:MAG: DUF7916 family protein [Vagococcus sp.]